MDPYRDDGIWVLLDDGCNTPCHSKKWAEDAAKKLKQHKGEVKRREAEIRLAEKEVNAEKAAMSALVRSLEEKERQAMAMAETIAALQAKLDGFPQQAGTMYCAAA